MKLGAWEVNSINHADLFTLCDGLPDASVDMILCDLPYGTTACAWDTVIPFEPMWARFKRVIKPKGAIVLTASQPFTSALVMSNPGMFRYEWIWLKEQGKQAHIVNQRPQKAHESALVFSTEPTDYFPQFWRDIPYNKKEPTKSQSKVHAPGWRGFAKKNQTDRYPLSYLYFNSETGLHPTQKPVALFRYLIRTYTQPGDLVLDPCVGSGTTALAAREEGRDYLCGDLSPEYVAIAQKRLDAPYTLNMFNALPSLEHTPQE